LTVQTVSRSKYDPTGTEYPVNILRNLALSKVKTSHVVYADVDFWPASNLHSILSQNSVRDQFASDPYLAAVIPAFQMARQCKKVRGRTKECRKLNIHSMPRDKDMLLELESKRMASPFRPEFAEGHGSTNYDVWRNQNEGSFEDLLCIYL
jgi:hypothetical protein